MVAYIKEMRLSTSIAEKELWAKWRIWFREEDIVLLQ